MAKRCGPLGCPTSTYWREWLYGNGPGSSTAPVNTVLPVISGINQVGNQLSTTNGTWTQSPTAYTYQWKRNGTNISGATNSTYTLTSTDYNTVITVTVTATNAIGSTPATSAGTSAILPAAPVNTVAPSISGTPKKGQVLTGHTGTWTGSPSFTYQWYRDGAPISGATSITYNPVDADLLHALTFGVTGSNVSGSASAASSSVGPVYSSQVSSAGLVVILKHGDSRERGANNTTGPGPTPTAGTVKQWNDSAIINIGATDTWNCPSGEGTPDPAFGIKFNALLGYIPVIVPAASSGSTIVYRAEAVPTTNTWDQSGGNLYDSAKTRNTAAMAAASVEEPFSIQESLGINDMRRDGTTLSPVLDVPTILSKTQEYLNRLHTDYPNTPILWAQEGRYESSVVSNRLYPFRKALIDEATTRDYLHIVGVNTSLIGSGGYGTDRLHRNQTGNNDIGNMRARWHAASGYSKWARMIIANHFDDLTTARKALIETFVNTQISLGNWFKLEYLGVFKTSNGNNIYLDWSLMTYITSTSTTFNVNSGVSTNGSTAALTMGFIGNINTGRVTQDDVMMMVKLKTRTTASGTAAYLFGCIDSGASFLLAQGSGTTGLIYRCNDNTATTYTGETAFASNNWYGVSRSGVTKYLLKNSSVLNSASVASTGLPGQFITIGALNNVGTITGRIAAEYESAWISRYSDFNTDGMLNGVSGTGGLNWLLANW